jgi:hypothetical protein
MASSLLLEQRPFFLLLLSYSSKAQAVAKFLPRSSLLIVPGLAEPRLLLVEPSRSASDILIITIYTNLMNQRKRTRFLAKVRAQAGFNLKLGGLSFRAARSSSKEKALGPKLPLIEILNTVFGHAILTEPREKSV